MSIVVVFWSCFFQESETNVCQYLQFRVSSSTQLRLCDSKHDNVALQMHCKNELVLNKCLHWHLEVIALTCWKIENPFESWWHVRHLTTKVTYWAHLATVLYFADQKRNVTDWQCITLTQHCLTMKRVPNFDVSKSILMRSLCADRSGSERKKWAFCLQTWVLGKQMLSNNLIINTAFPLKHIGFETSLPHAEPLFNPTWSNPENNDCECQQPTDAEYDSCFKNKGHEIWNTWSST